MILDHGKALHGKLVKFSLKTFGHQLAGYNEQNLVYYFVTNG
jgi:hypothetical protein